MFQDKIKKLRQATEDKVDEMIIGVMQDNDNVAIQLNWEQLDRGRNNLNKSLGRYRNRVYAQMKKRLNPRGVVDLNLTGRFWAGFYVSEIVLDKSEFYILLYSSDSKTEDLVKKYGSNLFGLQKTNLLRFAQACKPGIQKGFRNLIL